MSSSLTIEAKKILNRHDIRLTNCRSSVIQAFLLAKQAISQPDLEKQHQQFDRVTLYRTLHTFLNKGIIHQIFDETGVTKYALCSHDCAQHQHYDNHIHFKCTQCESLICFDDVAIPNFNVPKGYQIQDMNLLVRGVCNKCR